MVEKKQYEQNCKSFFRHRKVTTCENLANFTNSFLSQQAKIELLIPLSKNNKEQKGRSDQ